MRKLALTLVLLLAACSPRGAFHMTDISGAMPALRFNSVLEGEMLVNEDMARGKVTALYFGYTHCPDVCPATLANLTQMLDKVKSPDVQVLFVSVDPVRDCPPDSPLTLMNYTKAFSPQIRGLCGSDEEIASLARRYRVAYSVDKGPPYAVMHSNAVFFFDRSGKARLVTTDTSDTTAMAEDVERLLQ